MNRYLWSIDSATIYHFRSRVVDWSERYFLSPFLSSSSIYTIIYPTHITSFHVHQLYFPKQLSKTDLLALPKPHQSLHATSPQAGVHADNFHKSWRWPRHIETSIFLEVLPDYKLEWVLHLPDIFFFAITVTLLTHVNTAPTRRTSTYLYTFFHDANLYTYSVHRMKNSKAALRRAGMMPIR